MNFLHDLSESTKKLLDWTAATAAIASITMSQVAMFFSAAAGFMSFAWMCQRFYDRHFLNKSSDD